MEGATLFLLKSDTHNAAIFDSLQKDARTTMAQLGRLVHLSQLAVTERVRKLGLSGATIAYRAQANCQRRDCNMRAVVGVGRAEHARVVTLGKQSLKVITAWNVPNDDSWVMEIAVIT